MTFSQATREKLQAALCEQNSSPEYAGVIEAARQRGFRLAEVWERETLDPADLFIWRGTIWVRLHPTGRERARGEQLSLWQSGGVS